MPPWLLQILPLKDLQVIKTGEKSLKPRAWVGQSIVLLCPKQVGNRVHCHIAALNGIQNCVVALKDVDSEYKVSIKLPEQEPYCWISNPVFQVVDP